MGDRYCPLLNLSHVSLELLRIVTGYFVLLIILFTQRNRCLVNGIKSVRTACRATYKHNHFSKFKTSTPVTQSKHTNPLFISPLKNPNFFPESPDRQNTLTPPPPLTGSDPITHIHTEHILADIQNSSSPRPMSNLP